MLSPSAVISFRSSVLRLALPLTVLAACESRPIEPSPVQATPASPSLAADRQANPVLQWNTIAAELMTDPGPVIDSRAFAILHAAIHDAVNGVERRYQPYTADLTSPGASVEAAVAAAAREVLIALSPSRRNQVEARYVAALAAIQDGAPKTKGVSLGRRAAKANLQRREGDRVPAGPWPPQTGPITRPVYVPTGEPGNYDFTPPFDRPPFGPIALFPGWGRMEPFVAGTAKQRLEGPDALASREYARDLNRLKLIGRRDSPTRTPEQTEIARFWFEEFPTWNQIANRVIRRRGLDPWEAARILALMHFAAADAGFACFEAKYRFRFWRPFTAIRRAAEDGNPRTIADARWLPLLWTPLDGRPQTFLIPPIPEYPSAAATIASAAAAVLSAHLGDHVTFEATSLTLPGVTRRFDSFRNAAEEAGMSRVYGGIHFDRAVRDGHRLGHAVGGEVARSLPPANR